MARSSQQKSPLTKCEHDVLSRIAAGRDAGTARGTVLTLRRLKEKGMITVWERITPLGKETLLLPPRKD